MYFIGKFHPPDFSVSPNPVKNDCYINFYSEEEKNIRADILNYSGQYVMTLNFFIPKGEGYFYMDTRTLAEGIYLLKLSDCSFQKNITVLKL